MEIASFLVELFGWPVLGWTGGSALALAAVLMLPARMRITAIEMLLLVHFVAAACGGLNYVFGTTDGWLYEIFSPGVFWVGLVALVVDAVTLAALRHRERDEKDS